MKGIDVSVIVVNWNTCEVLRECLVSVYAQTSFFTFEVIVVDNASTDGSPKMVAAEFPQVIRIQNSENRGFAAANNQGIRVARGRYVLLLNSDTVILEGAVQKSIRFADQYSDVAVVGIRNLEADGALQKNCFGFASVENLLISSLGLHRLFPNNRLFGRERMLWWDFQTVREVEVVAGCYMLVRREAIDLVGLLDDAYFMYGEEMDWCWRFKQARWKVVYYPDACIIHYGGVSAAQNPARMGMEQQKSLLHFIEKTQGRVPKQLARVLLLITGFTRIAYWAIRSCFGDTPERKIAVSNRKRAQITCFGVFSSSPGDRNLGNPYARKGLFVRLLYLSVAVSFWILTGFGRLFCGKTVVLCYHGVRASQVKRFACQMKELRKRAGLNGKTKPAVIVTFDDAFQNLLENVLPVLSDNQIPAIVFAVPGNLGATPKWSIPANHPDASEKTMTAEQLKALKGFGLIRIGSHSQSHQNLTTLSVDRLKADLEQSKRELETLLDLPVDDLALPHGAFDQTVLNAAWEVGYKRVYTLEPHLTSDVTSYYGIIGRFLMSPDAWPIEAALTSSGAYAWRMLFRKSFRALSRTRSSYSYANKLHS